MVVQAEHTSMCWSIYSVSLNGRDSDSGASVSLTYNMKNKNLLVRNNIGSMQVQGVSVRIQIIVNLALKFTEHANTIINQNS